MSALVYRISRVRCENSPVTVLASTWDDVYYLGDEVLRFGLVTVFRGSHYFTHPMLPDIHHIRYDVYYNVIMKRWMKQRLPHTSQLFDRPGLRWLLPWCKRPDLLSWRRRSVARAVAIGLFSGLVPGPLQMLSAALLSVWWRANLPLAMGVTLYTNPLTIVPFYYVAFTYGTVLTDSVGTASLPHLPPLGAFWQQGWAPFLEWGIAAGSTLLLGLLALSLTLAVLGYVGVDLLWRCYIVRTWRCRRKA